MEYILITLLLIVLVSYGQITSYLHRYKNLKALKQSSACSQQAKQFYMAYIGVYQSGEQPYIQAVLKEIEFKPQIELKNESQMNFNVSPLAVKNLTLEPEHLKFSAKFNRQIIHLSIPLKSIGLISGQSGIGFIKK